MEEAWGGDPHTGEPAHTQENHPTTPLEATRSAFHLAWCHQSIVTLCLLSLKMGLLTHSWLTLVNHSSLFLMALLQLLNWMFKFLHHNLTLSPYLFYPCVRSFQAVPPQCFVLTMPLTWVLFFPLYLCKSFWNYTPPPLSFYIPCVWTCLPHQLLALWEWELLAGSNY